MNGDRIQTVMGIGEGVLVAVIDYFAHLGPGGVDYTAPTFWLGIAVAASRGVKGYFAAGVQAPEPPKPNA